MPTLTVRDIDKAELAGIAEDAKRNKRRKGELAVGDFLAFTKRPPITPLGVRGTLHHITGTQY